MLLFLILNSIQDLSNHPSSDVVKTRTTTDKEETRGVLISHRPPGVFDSNWGELLLEEQQTYLQTDARTDDGRLIVAGVNRVVDEWNTCMLDYDDTTLCAKKTMI